VLPPAKAGVGSAVNDATREAGGTLGVAVIGSVYTSLYGSQLAGSAAGKLGEAAVAHAKTSIGAGLQVAAHAPAAVHGAALDGITSSFMVGLHAGCFVAAGVCALGALAALWLPGRSRTKVASEQLAVAAA
jgi:hypothetical protein